MNRLFLIAVLTTSLHMQTQAAQRTQSSSDYSIEDRRYATPLQLLISLNYHYAALESRSKRESRVPLSSGNLMHLERQIKELTFPQLCVPSDKLLRLAASDSNSSSNNH